MHILPCYSIIIYNEIMTNETKRIVIVGAGFGGITVLKHLANKLPSGYSITLIDRHHHQLYTPSLYEIASIPKEATDDTMLKSSILLPINSMMGGKPIAFICDEFSNIDPNAQAIQLREHGSLAYDYVVLALGSETAYFNIPGLKENGFALKTFDDAVRMRNKIEELLVQKDEVHITVGGAGSAGIELVAEFVNFICMMKEKLVPTSNKCSVFFTLVEAAPDILPGFEPWVVELTKKRLKELGITMKINTAIVSVSDMQITFKDNTTQPNDILIWTGGVKGPTLYHSLGLEVSPKDSLVVDDFLRAKHPSNRIFAIGDNASIMNPTTQGPVVWNVPAAEAEAKAAAHNIVRSIAGKPLRAFTPAKKYPFVLAVGKKYAIADLIIFRFWGLSGWIAKQLIELQYVMSVLPPAQAFGIWWRSFKVSGAND